MEESVSYTVVTVAGEEVEIVNKVPEGDRIVLVTADGAKYIQDDQDSSYVRPFDAEGDVGGDSTGQEPSPENEGPVPPYDGLDADTMAKAEAEAAANAMGVNTTNAEAAAAPNEQEAAEPYTEEPPAGDPDAVDEAPTPEGDPGDSAATEGDPSDPESAPLPIDEKLPPSEEEQS